MFDRAYLPADPALLADIDSAAQRLSAKLRNLPLADLDISEYNRKYFGNNITNLAYRMQLYAYILAWSLAEAGVPRHEFVFVEYGGGSGIMSLLARETGVGTVIYNDIYDVSCCDAAVIAAAVGNRADHYVCGDIGAVIAFLEEKNIRCDAIASYDVIEHIYDIDGFIRGLGRLPARRLSAVMTSGANAANPKIRQDLMAKQRAVEHENQEKKPGHKERDCLRAYVEVRREMIVNRLRGLNRELAHDIVEQLVRGTRGRREADILAGVDEYLRTGGFPQPPSHPTNTCDPYTGDWMEHIMDPHELMQAFTASGFQAQLLTCFPGPAGNTVRRISRAILNRMLRSLGNRALRFAPCYTILAKNIPTGCA